MKRRILGILGFLALLAAMVAFDLDTAGNVRRKAARPRIAPRRVQPDIGRWTRTRAAPAARNAGR